MKLINSNRFFLEGTQNRFLHMATAHYGAREFMCFQDCVTGNTYIEEITGGTLERIEDDALAIALANFLEETGVLDVAKPTLPDDVWLRNRKTR